MSSTYQIVLRGYVSDRMLTPCLEEFDIDRTGTTTALTGTVIDSSQLHGIITHLLALGLDLVAIELIDDNGSTADDTPPSDRPRIRRRTR